MTPCDVENCSKPSIRRGWCNMHYERWRRHGTLTVKPRGINPFARIDKSDSNGCWLWQGPVNRDGYGIYRGAAHRWFYQTLVEPVPDDLQIDHLCRVRNCVNPDHLEPVTCAENLARALPFRTANPNRRPRPEECKYGHPFDAENTYIAPNFPDQRQCRACRRDRARRDYLRKKEAAAPSASPGAA